MLADMQTEIEAARVLWCGRRVAARSAGVGASVGADASRAKLYAGEMVNRVVYKAVQIHGSMGYSRESDVERMYRDARVISIYEGTSEIQRMIIARDLLAHTATASIENEAMGQPRYAQRMAAIACRPPAFRREGSSGNAAETSSERHAPHRAAAHRPLFRRAAKLGQAAERSADTNVFSSSPTGTR